MVTGSTTLEWRSGVSLESFSYRSLQSRTVVSSREQHCCDISASECITDTISELLSSKSRWTCQYRSAYHLSGYIAHPKSVHESQGSRIHVPQTLSYSLQDIKDYVYYPPENVVSSVALVGSDCFCALSKRLITITRRSVIRLRITHCSNFNLSISVTYI